ncbi:ankyrin [Amylocystis lapponica]|nr:ankyrin [Amylocystis lapponica]
MSNTVKSELYGLFKYLTVAPSPNITRPSIFDMTGRAKWDAWSATGQTYADRGADAEKRYLTIARDLGWEEDTSEHSRSGGENSMGNTVSKMSAPVGTSGSAISRLAISGNVQELLLFLNSNPAADLNEADENGYTPLHLACDRGHIEVVEILLDRGADMCKKDSDDFSALELAEIAEHDDIVALIKGKCATTRPG